jgi:predicted RNase H-like HicB family nuclease
MNFTVLLHEDETGGYWAEVEELPGCITQGETVEEVEINARDAIELFIDTLIDDYVDSLISRETPEPPTDRLTIGLKLERIKSKATS